MDLDATSFYPSAMYDEEAVYPKIESGFLIEVEVFSNQTFYQDGNSGAFSKIKFFKSPDLKVQHLPVIEKMENIELKKLRIGYIEDTLTSVDIQELFQIGGKVVKI